MRVWIDLDNSPHVPFFAPIIRELQRRGHQLLLTARPYAQTLELAELAGLQLEAVGAYGGRHPVGKAWHLLQRAWALRRPVRRVCPQVALSHGSRAQVIAAVLQRIPAVVCLDYEWTERWIFRWGAYRILVPEVAFRSALAAGFPAERLYPYPGLKEEVYLPEFVPQPGFREQLGVGMEECLLVLRPPSVTAHYRRRRTLELFAAVLRRLRREPQVVPVIVPRTLDDRQWVEKLCRDEGIGRARFLSAALPGLQLLYWADMVISGGGTMNREAALLGTPVYSVFAGRLGAVDRWLCQQGRLGFLQSVEDVERLRFRRVPRTAQWRYPDKGLAALLVSLLEEWTSCSSRWRISGGMRT
ncbi:hypothetical protein HRbin21_01538 [bacterium HR21]|nr:hypothetical protein HRbin21_01538 [bacterium HR21]